MPNAFAMPDAAASPGLALRQRAIEIRNHAEAFCDDAAGERLLALADEYEAQVRALEYRRRGT
jgi:hypothetical protein